MLRALRVVSVERGHDPAGFALVAFGGAGPAARVRARRRARHPHRARPRGGRRALGARARRERGAAGRGRVVPRSARRGRGAAARSGEADLRYAGQSFELTAPAAGRPRRSVPPRARGAVRVRRPRARRSSSSRCARPRSGQARRSSCARRAPSRSRGRVSWRSPARPCGSRRGGGERRIPTGRWSSSADERKHIHPPTSPSTSTCGVGGIDIQLQIVGSLLRAVAEEMGAALVRSAFSANIKERRDCSTALFDARGRMISQAEHIPVHLGAMPDAVAAVHGARPAAGRGLDPQRPLRRRHAPPRHHAPSPARRSASRSRARTTPTSAGASRARCPPTRARSRRKVS